MKILVNSKSLESRKKDYPHVENVSFDDLITKSDIISFHCKAASDGKPILTKEHFKKMKPTSYVINAARGNIVDEKDLNEALNKKIIYGAGLDVFEKEPPDNNNPLLKNKRVVLSPHAATFTQECLSKMSTETVQNIIDFFEGRLKNNSIVKL